MWLQRFFLSRECGSLFTVGEEGRVGNHVVGGFRTIAG